jgi:hypothetical protein
MPIGGKTMRIRSSIVGLMMALCVLFGATAVLAADPDDVGTYTCLDQREVPVRVQLYGNSDEITITGDHWDLRGIYAYYHGLAYSGREVRRYSISSCAFQAYVDDGTYVLHCGVEGFCLRDPN